MKKFAPLIVLFFVLTAFASIAISGNEAVPKMTMLSLLKAGQEVMVFHSESDFIVTIVDEKMKKLDSFIQSNKYEQNNIKGKILETGADYIVVSDTNTGFNRTIAAPAIHQIISSPD
jgi:hypothetical protein